MKILNRKYIQRGRDDIVGFIYVWGWHKFCISNFEVTVLKIQVFEHLTKLSLSVASMPKGVIVGKLAKVSSGMISLMKIINMVKV